MQLRLAPYTAPEGIYGGKGCEKFHSCVHLLTARHIEMLNLWGLSTLRQVVLLIAELGVRHQQ